MNPTREIIPLVSADVSVFCKNLRTHLATAGVAPMPSHLAMLNHIARSAGFRNYQALKANPLAADHLMAPANPAVAPAAPAITPPRDSTLTAIARRALSQFDTSGKLMRWPSQYAVQQIALWGLWLRLPGKRSMTEAETNGYLSRFHTFADQATLRRELVNARLLSRKIDCSDYRKVAKPYDKTIAEFLDALVKASVAKS